MKFSIIESLFLNINIYSSLLPIILFLVFHKTLNQKKALWVIFFYCIYAFINDQFLGNIPYENFQKVFLSFFTLAEFLFFSFYIQQIVESRRFKLIIYFTSLLFSVFLVIYFFTSTWRLFDSIPVGTEAILIFAFSVGYFYQEINKPTTLFIYNTASFWIIVGFMLYLAGSFFIFIYANFVPFDEIRKFWFVTFIFNILRNIFITIGILVSHYNYKNDSIHPNPYAKKHRHILN